MEPSTRANVHRAVKMAFFIGPVLTVINQTPALLVLLRGEGMPGATLGRIVLTFVVPFGVSLYSSTMADRAKGRAE